MKKNFIIISTVLMIVLLYMSISDNRNDFSEYSIGDEIIISDISYKVTMKNESKLLYDGDHLVEQINLSDPYANKYKFYYENELLITTEEFRNDEVFATKHKKYNDDKLIEERFMHGDTVVSIRNITYEGNRSITVVKDSRGEKDVTIFSKLDDKGNSISSVAKDSNNEILYSYKKKYNGDLLIELVDERNNGYRAENFYEYNDNGDLEVQRTTIYDGTPENYVVFYEYEYNLKKKPLIRRSIMLEDLSNQTQLSEELNSEENLSIKGNLKDDCNLIADQLFKLTEEIYIAFFGEGNERYNDYSNTLYDDISTDWSTKKYEYTDEEIEALSLSIRKFESEFLLIEVIASKHSEIDVFEYKNYISTLQKKIAFGERFKQSDRDTIQELMSLKEKYDGKSNYEIEIIDEINTIAGQIVDVRKELQL